VELLEEKLRRYF